MEREMERDDDEKLLGCYKKVTGQWSNVNQ